MLNLIRALVVAVPLATLPAVAHADPHWHAPARVALPAPVHVAPARPGHVAPPAPAYVSPAPYRHGYRRYQHERYGWPGHGEPSYDHW